MHHGDISPNIVEGLKVLWKRIEKSKIPPSRLDETLTIATWNIRHFGDPGHPRRDAAIHYIAEIIGQFDIVAVTELRRDLSELERVLRILGPYWDVIFSDWTPDYGGNKERIAYVYDKRAAEFTGLAAEADPVREKIQVNGREDWIPSLSWWRSPYVVSFRAGNFDFMLITVHTRFGDRVSERALALQALADWVDDRRNDRFVTDRDVILMGDFNIPSKRSSTYRAIISCGLTLPRAFTGRKNRELCTNLARDKRYDQILHYAANSDRFTDKGGVLDFYDRNHRPLFPGENLDKEEFTYQLSDHLPMWIQIDTDDDEEQLDQILSRRRRRRRS